MLVEKLPRSLFSIAVLSPRHPQQQEVQLGDTSVTLLVNLKFCEFFFLSFLSESRRSRPNAPGPGVLSSLPSRRWQVDQALPCTFLPLAPCTTLPLATMKAHDMRSGALTERKKENRNFFLSSLEQELGRTFTRTGSS